MPYWSWHCSSQLWKWQVSFFLASVSHDPPWEKLNRRYRSVSVSGAHLFVTRSGQHPNKHSQYFRKKSLTQYSSSWWVLRWSHHRSVIIALLAASFIHLLHFSSRQLTWLLPFFFFSVTAESPQEFLGIMFEPKSFQCEWESCVGWRCHVPNTLQW